MALWPYGMVPYVIGIVKHMCQGLNSHYFHIIRDGHQPVGVYIPIIRIPIKGGMTIPNIATFEEVPTSESRVWVGIC